MKKTTLTSAIIFSLLFFSCSKKQPDSREGIDPKPEVSAPSNIVESFREANSNDSTLKAMPKEKFIEINKNSLDKEFLLRVSFIRQPPSPTGTSLKSRVVSFRQYNDKLYMLEATKGHNVSKELPQTLIITDFPIISENESNIVFDFNKGMSLLFTSRDWKGSDEEGAKYKAEYDAVNVRASFIEKVDTVDNTLMLEQVASVEMASKSSAISATPVKVKYYLLPYHPDKDFEPTVIDDFDRMGFFNVSPLLNENSEPIVRASKFNIKKPIKYAVSANTPEPFKQAVKEGILYYNKILGPGKIEVIDAPAGVTAPDLKYNVVQWVDWDQAGSAYADAQMDPRSGETLQAQVYMTSAFAVSGKRAAKRYLLGNKEGFKDQKELSLQGFDIFHGCDFKLNNEFRSSLQILLAANANDSEILKVTQDYIREVVAHEIGHTLGLRHNFAGSLGANKSTKDRFAAFMNYLKGVSDIHDVISTSSVMDYSIFIDSVISGRNVGKPEEKPLPYDEKAISYLYLNKKYDYEDIPLFCTDSHTESFSDCVRFDAGPDIVESYLQGQQRFISFMASSMFFSFLSAKENQKDLRKVPISAEGMVGDRRDALSEMVNLLTVSNHFLSVNRSFPFDGGVYEKEILDKTYIKVEELIHNNGGFDKVFASVSLDEIKKSKEEFMRYLQDSTAFNDREKKHIEDFMNKFYDQLPAALEKADLESHLNVLAKLPDTNLSNEYAKFLFKKANTILFATSETKKALLNKADGTNIEVEYPIFTYPREWRLNASRLLKADKSSNKTWATVERVELKNKLKKIMTLSSDLSNIPLENFPEELLRWLRENQEIMDNLGRDSSNYN